MTFFKTADTRRLVSELYSITFILSQSDAEVFKRPAIGEGGWQSFQRELQKQISYDPQSGDTYIYLTKAQIDRIRQYSTKYGKSGGFQQRFQGILNSLRELKI